MRQPQTIHVPALDLRADVGAVNPATRTVQLTFSTGADVVRYDWDSGQRYIERLSLDPANVRLDRLNAGAPLLDAHSAYSIANQIGVIEPNSATLTGKAALAMVRFSKRADVEPYYQDVVDGIIRNVSVGYKVYRYEQDAQDDLSLPVRLATDWEPFEISMVPMGADPGAQTAARSGRLPNLRRLTSEVETHVCTLTVRGTHATADADRLRRARLARNRFF